MLQCRRALSAISNVAVFTSSRLAAITDPSALALSGIVEIESQWTAFQRANQLPEHLLYKEKNI